MISANVASLSQAQFARHRGLTIGAHLARLFHGLAVEFDLGGGLQQVLGRAARDVFLLLVEARQHLAVLLQFFAQGLDQFFKCFVHTLAASGVRRGGGFAFVL
jgi:hypothetical protein